MAFLLTTEAINLGRDKVTTALRLRERKVPVVPTLGFYRGGIIHEVDGPVVVKPTDGSQGRGVREYSDAAAAETDLGDVVMAKTEGQDLVAKSGEWRSNGFLGGTGQNRVLIKSERDLAVSACRALGLRYAGVDLLESASGPLVLELNCGSPFDGAERRTGRNIAEMIIKTLVGRE